MGSSIDDLIFSFMSAMSGFNFQSWGGPSSPDMKCPRRDDGRKVIHSYEVDGVHYEVLEGDK